MTPEAADRLGDVGALESLPKWVSVVPIVLQWLCLSLRYGSVTLPSSCNPSITTGGMVGEGKMEYLAIMGALARDATAKTGCVRAQGDASVAAVEDAMSSLGIAYPVVLKPDLGWCGYGVRRITDRSELRTYLAEFPTDEDVVVQEWIDQPGEAGIFYMRHPASTAGIVIGMLLRHFPQVVGDGRRSVQELVDAHARTRRIRRAGARLSCLDPDRVPEPGEVVRVSTVTSTRVGGRYQDGTALITRELRSRIDAIARDMNEFHVGRFDVKFSTLEALRAGCFTIIEVNGAGSEAAHAWDPSLTLVQAYRIIFDKQRRLFALSDDMRLRGHRPIGWRALANHHLRQQHLIGRYPASN